MFYRGKSLKGKSNVGSKILIEILNKNKDIIKENNGNKIYMDSFFSNIQLGLILDNIGITFISTTSSNRKFIPDVIKSFDNMKNGDVRCFKVYGSKLKIIQIKDNTHDTILLTNNDNTTEVVKIYRKSNFNENEYYEKEITYQQYEYRHGMCGVDIFDRGCEVVNVRRRTTRWTMAYFEILVNASLVNVFTIINYFYRQKKVAELNKSVHDLPQTCRLNRRNTLYEIGKSLCKKYQMKNLEEEEIIRGISFENQLKHIKRIRIEKKRNKCFTHLKIYHKTKLTNRYCPCCSKACCDMHLALNGICFLCNEFNESQIRQLDSEFKKLNNK